MALDGGHGGTPEGRRREPVGRLLGQRALDHLVEQRRRPLERVAGLGRRVVDVGIQLRGVVIALERDPPCQRFVEHTQPSEYTSLRASSGWLFFDLLR